MMAGSLRCPMQRRVMWPFNPRALGHTQVDVGYLANAIMGPQKTGNMGIRLVEIDNMTCFVSQICILHTLWQNFPSQDQSKQRVTCSVAVLYRGRLRLYTAYGHPPSTSILRGRRSSQLR